MMRIPSLFVWGLLISTARAQTDSPLNLLFIMDDQHNPRMLGGDSNGYGGVPESLTPNLDQIANEGVRFPHAYCAAPQCVPSRFSILTGRFPHLHGARWNKIWEPARGELTLPALARRHGYFTGTIGKHHLAWLDQSGSSATDHGFDRVQDLDDYKRHCHDNGVPPWQAQGNHWRMEGVTLYVGYTFNPNPFHPSGYFADQAIDFLEDRAGPGGDGQPFVLWLSFDGPHTPILPSGPADPNDWAHRYHPFAQLDLPANIGKVADTARLQITQAQYAHMSDEDHREALSYYYGLVSQIDYNIGRVLGRLQELGLRDHTVVVFTSDHGEFGAEMACWTKGGGSYDCLTRVPLLIRTPGQLVAGHVAEVPTASVDLFPTLVELLGLTPTPVERTRVNGRSLAGIVLAGEVPGDWPEEVFSEFGPPAAQHRMAVSVVDKYSFDEMGGGQEEYFELNFDPWEEHNRIGDPLVLPRVEELRSLLTAWWGNEADHAPNYLGTGDPDDVPFRVEDPVPRDNKNKVRTNVDPRWLPATSAESQEIFFGTDPNQLPAFALRPPMADHFNAGTLAEGTTYYWRVDSINANGVTPGPVWSFKTVNPGHGGPGLAHSPLPDDGTSGVSQNVVLAWGGGEGVMAHDVWFGPKEGPLERVVRGMPIVSYAPKGLLGGRTYLWRVDGTNVDGKTVGDEWTFTVDGSGLSQPAGVPYPAHLASGVSLPLVGALLWVAGQGALEHDVYFGTDFPLPYHGRQDGPAFVPGPLELGRTYYWRIDEVNDAGVRTGFTWRFTTEG